MLLPNRNKLERRMLDSFARKLVASKEMPKIVSRTIKVGHCSAAPLLAACARIMLAAASLNVLVLS